MAVMITLRTLVDEMEALGDGHAIYLNPHTDEVVLLSREEISAVEDDLPNDGFPAWQQPLIAHARAVLGSTAYLRLPTHDEIHEYAIVERFCETVDEPHLRRLFLDQIRGSGAFRRFKQVLRRYAREEEWYQFRTEAIQALVIQWLDAHQIPYR